MSLNHILSQSQFSESDGLGGRKEDLSIAGLSLNSLVVSGDVDIAGTVGIGITHDPTIQLVVNESNSDANTAKFIGNSTSTNNFLLPPVIQLQNNTATNGNYETIVFKNSSSYPVAAIGAKNINHTTTGSGDLYLSTLNAGTAVQRLYITSDGKTGIGTTTPSNINGLEVKGNTTLDSNLNVQGATLLDEQLVTVGATSLYSTLEVGGNTTLSGLVTANNGITLTAGNINAGGGSLINTNFGTAFLSSGQTLNAREGVVKFFMADVMTAYAEVSLELVNSFATTGVVGSFGVVVDSTDTISNTFYCFRTVAGGGAIVFGIQNLGPTTATNWSISIYFKIFATS